MKTILVVAGALILLSVASLQATIWHFTDGYCQRLKSQASEQAVQSALRSWVGMNWSARSIPANDLDNHDGVVPGVRWVPAHFDAALLGMGENAHVRLLGPGPLDLVHSGVAPEAVTAISFTERSRYAIAVQVPQGQPTTLRSVGSSKATGVAPDIWVVCDD